MNVRGVVLSVLVAASCAAWTVRAQRGGPDPGSESFKGIAADGSLRSGLFAIRATGVSTRPVVQAASQFLDALTPEQ